MRLSHILFIQATVCLLAGAALAEGADDPIDASPASPEVVSADVDVQVDAEAEAGDLAWDQFDDPAFDPAAAGSGEAVAPEALTDTEAPAQELDPESTTTLASGVVLGPQGVDDQGRTGRLHTVSTGDTLWDLSAAYLGTPWVWPSVWIDNDDIANPHLIVPGDKIWITANEMRVVTDAEAESFLEPVVADQTVAAMTDMPIEPGFEETPIPVEVEAPPLAALDTEDDASTLDAFPVAIPGQEPTSMPAGRQITVSRRDAYGFVSADDLAGASTIVESSSERTYLSSGDPVYIGLGEGDTAVGDQFMVFEVVDEVRDVETNRVLGHHVENLGWIEVKELTGDTSIGEIRQSYSEIPRGARVIAREKLSRRVTVRSTPDAIEGQVVFLPSSRTMMADGGYVYLNRGEFHGVELGSELEIFDTGAIMNERERRVDVRTPDTPIATLIVVTVEPESSVAFVLSATREIAIGDAVRPATGSRVASR